MCPSTRDQSWKFNTGIVIGGKAQGEEAIVKWKRGLLELGSGNPVARIRWVTHTNIKILQGGQNNNNEEDCERDGFWEILLISVCEDIMPRSSTVILLL